jgi:hypothetical protein
LYVGKNPDAGGGSAHHQLGQPKDKLAEVKLNGIPIQISSISPRTFGLFAVEENPRVKTGETILGSECSEGN